MAEGKGHAITVKAGHPVRAAPLHATRLGLHIPLSSASSNLLQTPRIFPIFPRRAERPIRRARQNHVALHRVASRCIMTTRVALRAVERDRRLDGKAVRRAAISFVMRSIRITSLTGGFVRRVVRGVQRSDTLARLARPDIPLWRLPFR